MREPVRPRRRTAPQSRRATRLAHSAGQIRHRLASLIAGHGDPPCRGRGYSTADGSWFSGRAKRTSLRWRSGILSGCFVAIGCSSSSASRCVRAGGRAGLDEGAGVLGADATLHLVERGIDRSGGHLPGWAVRRGARPLVRTGHFEPGRPQPGHQTAPPPRDEPAACGEDPDGRADEYRAAERDGAGPVGPPGSGDRRGAREAVRRLRPRA